MSGGPRDRLPVFDEESRPRPRRRDDEAPVAAAPARAASVEPALEGADVLRELRRAVRATVDEWLAERSGTVALAVSQAVEDIIQRMASEHAARIGELRAAHESAVAALEAEGHEAMRAAGRKRRARVREVERELRDRIERLERSLTDASLEGIERLREVERRETEARLELERTYQQRLREKDEEIDRLRRTTSSSSTGDSLFDALHDQLRSRRDQH